MVLAVLIALIFFFSRTNQVYLVQNKVNNYITKGGVQRQANAVGKSRR